MTTDPFRTAELRSAVLAAWQRSPARFREDANTEEDHATGYYRDRVIVELAQNAADAAARAGVPGRLVLRLVEDHHGARLVAANTGAGLDADGVASLASLRASAKTAKTAPTADPAGDPDDSGADHAGTGAVGRFGVGFAAVRSVSDDITVASREGGVRFGLDQARAALAELPALSEQVGARGIALPVLRLPFPAPAHPSAADDAAERPDAADPLTGLDTVISLVLRDAAAVGVVRQQLAAVDDALLLALPALTVIEIDDGQRRRELRDAQARWISVTRSGSVPAELLAHRPVEERARTGWSVTWAYPRDASHPVTDAVVHAPTPTDEPLSLPALLLATLPLDPSRRHVAEGPLAQFMVGVAAQAFAELARDVPQPLDLVPVGLPRGRLDAELCDAAIEELRRAPVFSGRLAADLSVIDGEVSPALVAALTPTGLGVVEVQRRQLSAARRLGMQVRTLPDVIDALPDGLPPWQWHDLYDALTPYADHDRSVREALDAILVPCADGGTVRGAHGLILSQAPKPPILDGLRVVHPEAAHPLLRRLGALPDDDPAVLALPAVERAVHRAADDLLGGDVDESAAADDLAAVLMIVDRVAHDRDLTPADLPSWLSLVPLPDEDGTWQHADEVSWPGSWADEHLDLGLVDTSSLVHLTEATARVLGVRFALSARLVDPGAADVPVPGWADYLDYLASALGPDEIVDAVWTVADLDVVEDASWPAAVDLLTHDADLHRAVVTGVRSGAPAPGEPREALSYTAWYLRDAFGAPWAAGASPDETDGGDLSAQDRAADERQALGAVLAPRPSELAELDDPELTRVLGGVSTYRDLFQFLAPADPVAWDGFFAGLSGTDTRGDGPVTGTPVDLALARVVWTALELACGAGLELDPLPDVVIALQGATARIVAADVVVVTDQPMWAQVRAVLPVTASHLVAAVADAMDCDVPDASDVSIHGDLDGSDEPVVRDVPRWIDVLVPGVPAQWSEHAQLSVDGHEVDWWVAADGGAHVRAGAASSAPARACAQAAGRWGDRYLLEIALRDGQRHGELVAGSAWDGVTP